MSGRLLFEVDPEVRVNWQATTRRIDLHTLRQVDDRRVAGYLDGLGD
ncbi:MAG: hypothetical protein M3415_03470 [Actinomycetota bacterium]|nr:hypothetical protein [Actinomycetota bacterium]